MALDDASPQAGSYPAPSARASPQETPSLGPNPAMARNFTLRLKSDFVVRPDYFTMAFGFLGRRNWEKLVAYTMMERVENSWLLTGRVLTQDELDAFTAYSTRTLYYRRMGVPIASFLGTAYLYNKTRKDLNLPSNTSPAKVFTSLRNLAKVDKAGFRSMMGASAFKMLFLTTSGAIMSGFLALWTETQGVVQDPRLRGFVEDMRGQKPEDVRQRKIKAASERVRAMRSGEQDIEPYIVQELRQPGAHIERSDTDSYAYDSSPTSTSDEEIPYGTPESSTQIDQQRPTPTTPRRPAWGAGSQAVPSTGSTAEPSTSTDYFLGGPSDDASPTAPEYRNTNPDGSPSGSAWDRLRRQTGSQPSRTPPPQQWGQPQNSPETSTYTSGSETDMYYANKEREQNQAQAEFDRLLDAERRASSESSQGRGW
ncbi:Uncharacterized protein PECH_008290 [Penicillium ucsense]|uniref:Endo-1,3(4)-beta-glucanase n=1 Tax=Penicillium ucsense TaxID=2839758 RepID=A0A8J8VZJ5_9EURO|nr:Uncharacterized protein PECM_007975 [Penicillium ucsense]KAF7734272.1 Uncharacterized protein PECH_008290 [Penicillium ucsense]